MLVSTPIRAASAIAYFGEIGIMVWAVAGETAPD
jgi:hypothetical protein